MRNVHQALALAFLACAACGTDYASEPDAGALEACQAPASFFPIVLEYVKAPTGADWATMPATDYARIVEFHSATSLYVACVRAGGTP